MWLWTNTMVEYLSCRLLETIVRRRGFFFVFFVFGNSGRKLEKNAIPLVIRGGVFHVLFWQIPLSNSIRGFETPICVDFGHKYYLYPREASEYD